MQQSFRGLRGMQVHAVPESEKAIDASGRKLPWGYELAAGVDSHEPLEKGPFGRSQRRSRTGLSRSRSKTAEPRREEEKIKAEQLAAEEAVFGSLRKISKDESRREALGEVDANTVPQSAAQIDGSMDATEVLLFGFGAHLQWAAIDFYERVSGGGILEDYDRQPVGRTYDVSRSLSRATLQRSLSKAALKKKNRFAGGEHWIKVTFDSQAAAELACARSPHTIKGHLVYAEPYQGRGPGKDEAIPASQAGAQITDSIMPASFSTNTLTASPNASSTTATSATAAVQQEEAPSNRSQQPPNTEAVFVQHTEMQQTTQPVFHERHPSAGAGCTSGHAPGSQLTLHRRGKIEGATPAVVLPATAAWLPKQPKKSWSAWLGAGDLIGSTVPKREDGRLDWEHASLYWKIFFWIDLIFGTDFCGLKGD